MTIIHILYLIASAVSICAGAPQLRKLLRTKHSGEFSLPTWVTWLATQTVALIYAISVNDGLYAIVSAVWLTFYLLMVVLIVKYRPPRELATANEEITKQ